ncbi:hypothetical protein RvY_15682 [Ramazzottius varieornatus]|uniref:CHHC U11-48K-type domain-containing protein n=1 Tax=Ramazzottius varieornatus TaxID=947166 RepID=A0A1D1VVT6_RAMVA|nr:hypothetical protein RvY_15682 [Ramazzottius varieornatus]
MARPSFSYAELKKAAFHKDQYDPDDLVTCPFVESHFLKRKKLPYHINECKVTHGRGFLSCPFSQYHFFRTKEELRKHEYLCPSRQNKNALAAPSLYDEDGNGIAISSIKDRMKVSENDKKPAKSYNVWAPPSAKSQRGKNEVEINPPRHESAQRRSLRELTRTVLFSRNRKEPLLKLEEPKEQRRTSDRIQVMSTVAEESEDSPEDVSDSAATAPVPVQLAPQPKVAVPPVQSIIEDTDKNLDGPDPPKGEKDHPQLIRKRLAGTGVIGVGTSLRFEDGRDAQEDPINYPVAWSMYPKYYREELKAKYARDNEIYKTGINPRYKKALDRQGASRSGLPDPLRFQLFAAWFEDLVWKPAPVEENAPDRKKTDDTKESRPLNGDHEKALASQSDRIGVKLNGQ